tara:strand:- start:1416 stop:1592 length:177 start_codon:yes stop_codon:yes gene_type:complete
MDSREKIILEISTVVESLSLKIEKLQAKVNELCQNTQCAQVKKVNKDLSASSTPEKAK